MSERAKKTEPSASFAERGSRFMRNINILGAVALGGAAIAFPEFSGPLLALAAVDVAQAVFFDTTGRMAKKRHATRLKPA